MQRGGRDLSSGGTAPAWVPKYQHVSGCGETGNNGTWGEEFREELPIQKGLSLTGMLMVSSISRITSSSLLQSTNCRYSWLAFHGKTKHLCKFFLCNKEICFFIRWITKFSAWIAGLWHKEKTLVFLLFFSPS